MPGRVDGKVAVVVGAGQTPGESIGNGRATAILLAREGATVVVADRDLNSAQDTVDMILAEHGKAVAIACDAINEASVQSLIADTIQKFSGIDILHNNVGASIALGDAVATDITEEAFDRSFAVNLKSHWLSAKYALSSLRERHGSIVNIASLAVLQAYPFVGYKTMKAAVVALTENLAAGNARYGVRANVILPGLMNTPMAIESRVASGQDRGEVIAHRDSLIPLGGKMGTAWDVAYAALFLHSDEARFITGVTLPVDGGEVVCYGGTGSR